MSLATLRAVQRHRKTNSIQTVDLHCLFECSSLIVVGFLVLNLLPRFLEWLLILKLKFYRSRYLLDIFHCCFSESEVIREPKPCYRDTHFKRTLISSPRFSEAIRVLNSDWLSDSIMNGDWLYFSHVKNAIRKPDWTYRFFTSENIAHIEFYLQGLLPKILAIYTIKWYTEW